MTTIFETCRRLILQCFAANMRPTYGRNHRKEQQLWFTVVVARTSCMGKAKAVIEACRINQCKSVHHKQYALPHSRVSTVAITEYAATLLSKYCINLPFGVLIQSQYGRPLTPWTAPYLPHIHCHSNLWFWANSFKNPAQLEIAAASAHAPCRGKPIERTKI